MKIFFLILIIFSFLGCSSFKNALTGQSNKRTADEFLIEKKKPLSMPPDFDKLPVPNSKQVQTTLSSEEKNIIEILENNENNENNKNNENNSDKSLSIENLIINKIKKD